MSCRCVVSLLFLLAAGPSFSDAVKFDEQGGHIRFSYFDANNKPVPSAFGFAYAIKHYNHLGVMTELQRFDVNGKPVSRPTPPEPMKIDEQEIAKIKQVALNYLIALQTLDPALMKATLHPSLEKYIVEVNESGASDLRKTTFEQMMQNAANWNRVGTRFPKHPRNQAIVLDAYNRMAAVKLLSDNWVEYIHLVKLGDIWYVKDLVWDLNRPDA